jgi:NAD-dependent dihydropyrimidine dehydrogenase PreA subunit
MATSLPPTWHGIPRDQILWNPTVDDDVCIGCTLCFATCGREVYEWENNRPKVSHPTNCMVGCTTCGTICPVLAISFPDRDSVWKLEREHKIFKEVRREAKEKLSRMEAQKARQAAEADAAGATTRTRMQAAGEFGEKRILVKLEELVRDRPFDIVNVDLHVPTLKGALEGAPSVMTFEVTSTDQSDIQAFLAEVRTLVADNGLVLSAESKL